jgi:hypothetical protein
MFVRTKLESDRLMKSLGVNYSPFEVCYSIQDVEKYLYDIAEPIGIREKRAGGGQLICNLSRQEAHQIILDGRVLFPLGIYHDVRETDSHLIYQGEIQLLEDYTLNARYCSVPGIKNREACKFNEGRINVLSCACDFSSPLHVHAGWYKGWSYRPLQEVIDYLVHFQLVGPVVEFSFYDVKLGCKNENIIIWEIRSY